jgi:RES domain-containing protein
LDWPAQVPSTSVLAKVHRISRKGFDPLSILGSARAGGRYNPAGEFGALYTSMEEATATAEVRKGLRDSGIEPTSFPAGEWLIYDIEAEIDPILDLTASKGHSRVWLARRFSNWQRSQRNPRNRQGSQGSWLQGTSGAFRSSSRKCQPDRLSLRRSSSHESLGI